MCVNWLSFAHWQDFLWKKRIKESKFYIYIFLNVSIKSNNYSWLSIFPFYPSERSCNHVIKREKVIGLKYKCLKMLFTLIIFVTCQPHSPHSSAISFLQPDIYNLSRLPFEEPQLRLSISVQSGFSNLLNRLVQNLCKYLNISE